MKQRLPEHEARRQNNRKSSPRERHGRQQGWAREKQAMIALYQAQLPPWFQRYRRATREEDFQGKDLVITTDFGDVYIQIKSSPDGCREFYEIERDFPVGVVMIREKDSLEFIRANIMAAAFRMRGVLYRNRRQASCGHKQTANWR